MVENIEVSTIFAVTPQRLYEAWLDAEEHGKFSGGIAVIEPRVGARFSAWDGYITGTTLELTPHRRILQSWRTSDFPAGSPDSLLEVLLTAEADGTRLTLRHTNIPEGQGEEYRQGWLDYYFEPMQAYFAGGAD